ncbi:melanocortin 2 receptor accessory protein (predicted), isoform CRA_c [Rattus norvegicus]|uniref:Melanocortin 2 receptor accessory protein (Predicted), isoform CRA_c n=1 Tax=Rattus norvegicus TaxID=10116 RepID=A6JLC5_RAT|nr:melanocortin 2 receptor accessory protein (predicted), isoform CRA_c [Rattus norvegicus]
MPGDPQTSPGDSDRNQLPNRVSGAHSPPPGVWPLTDTAMANRTDASVPFTSYEYYLDYIDLIPVDEKKLKANKLTLKPTGELKPTWTAVSFTMALNVARN